MANIVALPCAGRNPFGLANIQYTIYIQFQNMHLQFQSHKGLWSHCNKGPFSDLTGSALCPSLSLSFTKYSFLFSIKSFHCIPTSIYFYSKKQFQLNLKWAFLNKLTKNSRVLFQPQMISNDFKLFQIQIQNFNFNFNFKIQESYFNHKYFKWFKFKFNSNSNFSFNIDQHIVTHLQWPKMAYS